MTVNKLQLPAKENAVQLKINEIIDNLGGGGGANTDLSNLTATGEAHFLKNKATGGDSLTIAGTASSFAYAVNIGFGSMAMADGATALGKAAIVASTANYGIQIGEGGNPDAYTAYMGFGDINNVSANYKILDGTTGLIPDDRISSNIARTSQIPIISGLANTSLSNLTATGKKVIDGQWVLFSSAVLLTSATSASTTTVTSTLKNAMGTAGTDSYKYEIMIQYYFNYKSTTASITFTTSSFAVGPAIVSSGATAERGVIIIPVDADKVLSVTRGAAVDTGEVYLRGYRRIGTNS